MSSKFISKKLIKDLRSNNKFSKPIIRVSIISIAISILVMLISVSIVRGFQDEIKSKVVNFASHFQISDGGFNYSYESAPILIDDEYIKDIASIDGVKHIQTYALKPGLIQSKADTQYIKDDKIKIIRDIEGVIFKGLNHDFNWDFLNKKIIEGNSFRVSNNETNDSIIISSYLSKKLKLKLNDRIAAYFIKGSGISPKPFIISGIYETGLEEFDKQFTLIDIKHIQKLNNWGVEANLMLDESCYNGQLKVKAIATGGSKNYIYNWGDGYTVRNYQTFCIPRDTTIRVIISNFEVGQSSYRKLPSGIPDTAWLAIQSDNKTTCGCDNNSTADYESVTDNERRYTFPSNVVSTNARNTGGSKKYYVGGYEVFIDDFNRIDEVDEQIGNSEALLKVSKIVDSYPEIFGWLNILDTNVYVIIILMIMVAIINILALLLVLIIERSSMIGLLKSFGADNYTIQKIFISLGGFILLRGILIGNGISFVLIFLQKYFGIIKLPQENYFLSTVPMSIEVIYFILVNLITLGIGYLILYLVSLFIAKINPIKTIKFN